MSSAFGSMNGGGGVPEATSLDGHSSGSGGGGGSVAAGDGGSAEWQRIYDWVEALNGIQK